MPRYAESLYAHGRGIDTTTLSMEDARRAILAQRGREENHEEVVDQDERVKALTGLYMYMLVAWYGKSLSQLQLCNVTSSMSNLSWPTTLYDVDSVRPPPDWIYEEEGDFWGPHCVVPDGMDRLLQPMLEAVGSMVKLNQVVDEISFDDSNDGTIHVRCQSGETYTARACVVTLPINHLRQHATELFRQTPLSETKTEAMQYISMGSYKKVMLTFDRIFWPTEPPFLGLTRACTGDGTATTDSTRMDGLGASMLIDNLWAGDGYACFEAILVGEAADWATDRPDEEICAAVLDFVQQAFGLNQEDDKNDASSWCTGCHITRWEEDPYSLGAYASLSLGALPRHIEALGAPEWGGALMLAGDAVVEDFEGGVHAALWSGRAAAEHVHAYLSPSSRG